MEQQHSFWKRILLLPKTMMLTQSSPSSSHIFDGGESQAQIVQSQQLTEKLHNGSVDGGSIPGGSSGDFSDYFSTASLASHSSSEASSAITRCNCHIENCCDGPGGCHHHHHHHKKTNLGRRRTLWLCTTLVVSLAFVVILALTLAFTLSYNSNNHQLTTESHLPAEGMKESGEADMSLESSEDSGKSNNKLFDSANYVDEVYREEGWSGENNKNENNNNNDESQRTNNSGKSPSQPKLSKVDLKKFSRQSWEFLNRNQQASQRPSSSLSGSFSGSSSNSKLLNSVTSDPSRTIKDQQSPHEDDLNGDGVVLPAVMVYTSEGEGLNGKVTNLLNSLQKRNNDTEGGQGKTKKNCCRTQKYIQTVKLDGCEPLKIVNKMCSGQCMSVWIPGVFSSFPVCQPSRSHWKVITLTCGPHRDKKRRVRVEKVRRCSCMEVTNPT